MDNTEILYRYCRKRELMFTYCESKYYINIVFSTAKHRCFSYTYDKDLKKITRLCVGGKNYEDFELALSDFDDMLLLDKQIYMNF